MKKKWKFFVIILLVVGGIWISMPKKPKLISNITSLDTYYLTILVDPREIGNREKLEEKILKMCREDSFDTIKLYSVDRRRTTKWNISIYSSKRALEKGNVFMRIKYEEGE